MIRVVIPVLRGEGKAVAGVRGLRGAAPRGRRINRRGPRKSAEAWNNKDELSPLGAIGQAPD